MKTDEPILLFTEDFNRSSLYELLGPVVTTADWRGAIGYIRSHSGVTILCELSSARAIDVLRAVMRDEELKSTRVIGIAMDPETTATARTMGLSEIVEEGEWDKVKGMVGRAS